MKGYIMDLPKELAILSKVNYLPFNPIKIYVYAKGYKIKVWD